MFCTCNDPIVDKKIKAHVWVYYVLLYIYLVMLRFLNKRVIIIHFFLMNTFYLIAQENLVPNASFEENQNCVDDTVFNNFSPLGIIVKDWFNPTRSSPDYFSTSDLFEECSAVIGSIGETSSLGSPSPYHLNHHLGCALIFPFDLESEYREYFEAILTEELIAGNHYQVSLFTSITRRSSHRINSLGIHFSNELISDSNETASLNLIPQIQIDTMFGQIGTWMHLVDTIIAIGGEKFMTIGNFNTDENTQFEPLVGSENENGSLAYYLFDSLSVKLITDTKIDNNFLSTIQFYPNPVNDFIYIDNFHHPPNCFYNIYDVAGRKIIHHQILKNKINISTLSNGIYILELVNDKTYRKTKFIKN
jgi:Secretion system C-terminal sorting domain